MDPKAVYRALKRAVVREIYRALTGNCSVPDYTDLRPARHAKNLTLTAAANALNVWPSAVSQIELGRRRDDALAQAYRVWAALAVADMMDLRAQSAAGAANRMVSRLDQQILAIRQSPPCRG